MDKHFTWKGYASERMQMEDWEWKNNRHVVAILASKVAKPVAPITYIESLADAKVEILIDGETIKR